MEFTRSGIAAALFGIIIGTSPVFAHISPPEGGQDPDAARYRRVFELRSCISAYIDSLHTSDIEDIFTLGKGGNAPQDAIEKMNRVLDGTFRNPEAQRVSDAVQSWGRMLRWEFRDLGRPLVTRIVIEKSTHTARCYNGDELLLSTRIATGNPEIGKDTTGQCTATMIPRRWARIYRKGVSVSTTPRSWSSPNLSRPPRPE
jgi:hypothetical protein